MQTGDLLFTRMPDYVFRKVAAATQTWTSHVGIVYGRDESGQWLVAESKIPRSVLTPLSRFLGRSEKGRYSWHRVRGGLTEEQKRALQRAVQQRLGIWYHLGFHYESKRQFCSKFVREIFLEATGLEIGTMESFAELRERQPDFPLLFWMIWFWGRIPWDRKTVSPASQYRSDKLETLADGHLLPVIEDRR